MSRDAEDAPRDALPVAEEADGELRPDGGAVLPDDLDLERPAADPAARGVLPQRLREAAARPLDRLGREQPLQRQPQHLLRGVAGEAADRGAHVRDLEVEVRGPDDVHDVLGHQAVALLGLAQGPLRPGALRDVAEAPDAAGHGAPDDLRLGVAFEHPAVLERQDVEALLPRRVVQGPDLGDELLGARELFEHGGEGEVVVLRVHHRLGEPPHLGELPVPAHHLAVAVHHEDAVGGRLEDGAIDRDGVGEVLRGAPPVRDVHQRAHHQRPAGRQVGGDGAGIEHRPHAAVRTADLHLEVADGTVPAEPLDFPGALRGIDPEVGRAVEAEGLERGNAEDLQQRGIAVEDLALGRRDVDALAEGIHEVAQRVQGLETARDAQRHPHKLTQNESAR